MRQSILAVLLLAAAGGASAEQYYKWKDANGTWQYSATPPKGVQAERIGVRSGGATAAPAATDPAAAQPAAEAPATAPADPSTAASIAEKRRLACEEAQAAVAIYEGNPAVSLDADGDGQAEPLSAQQHAAELARAREVAKLYCEGA